MTAATTFTVGATAIFPGAVRSVIARIREDDETTWITDAEGDRWEHDLVLPLAADADERIQIADTALEAAWQAIGDHRRPRRMTLAWAARQVELYTTVTAALHELTRAKEAAGRMRTWTACDLRAKADAELAKARDLYEQTARRLANAA